MKSLLITAVLATGGAASSASSRGPTHLSAGFEACTVRDGTNTVQRNVCAQDDRLNRAYPRVMRADELARLVRF